MTNNLDVNSIVSIEQMPKIFYQLEIIGQEIDKNLKDLDKLVCTEENKQEVKKRKQELGLKEDIMYYYNFDGTKILETITNFHLMADYLIYALRI